MLRYLEVGTILEHLDCRIRKIRKTTGEEKYEKGKQTERIKVLDARRYIMYSLLLGCSFQHIKTQV